MFYDPNLPEDHQGTNDPGNSPEGQEIPNECDVEVEDDLETSEVFVDEPFIAFEDLEFADTFYLQVKGNEEAIKSLNKLLQESNPPLRLGFGQIRPRHEVEHLCQQLDWHEMVPGTLAMIEPLDLPKLKSQKITIFITSPQNAE